MSSRKRKAEDAEQSNTASKRRRITTDTNTDAPKTEIHATGLTNVDISGIDHTKWAEQRVREVEVEGCVHKICYPPCPTARNGKEEKDSFADADNELNLDFSSLDSECIKEFVAARSFELDVFQKQSVCAIEAQHNVLVSAHTSAGKTTVAEYAISKALSNNQRVIYTSPIKALSNQKFRQLQEQFLDVGLVTGDTSMNRDASCIVMTTEILRNMLYRGAEIIREISW